MKLRSYDRRELEGAVKNEDWIINPCRDYQSPSHFTRQEVKGHLLLPLQLN